MKYTKALTFSYDDGVEQDRQLVEILNRYGMKCTFNLNTGIQTADNTFDIEGTMIKRMNQEGMNELYAGHEIAMHGLTHAGIYYNIDQIQKKYEASEVPAKIKELFDTEYQQNAADIERLYGAYPVGMAYPYGDCEDRLVEYLRDMGVSYGRTTGVTHGFELPTDPLKLDSTCHHDDEQLFDLAEKFLSTEFSEESPGLFYIWGHSYEYYVHHNWDRLERLCEMLAGRGDIFYGTNEECLRLFGAI